MTGKVIRFPDPDRRSREPDAILRNPSESALIIILPIVRIERLDKAPPPRRRRRRPQ